ncbi:catalase family peroxidase [Streptomyces sp. uw30]|uniref:catalase family peroxidase n=1 Tax=Streptomyces sp. uw30 TaxID=1828179 RepID=UPI0011CE4872|nr:catalase family peroxidase [Streptomyces sp. uw30]TXS52510.1 catalase family peroxidase [Streptomyces sp. uw30]
MSNDPVAPTVVQVVDSMERMGSGPYPGLRRSSARGVCFVGTFTPTGQAAGLSTAAHFQHRPVPVTVRFSNSEGNPHVPDAAPVTRGMATRFHLPDGTHTDLLGITVPLFVASTPAEFHGLTEALRPDAVDGRPDPAAVQAHVTAHPQLAAAITQVPPVPVSYGSAAYWAVHAFIWVDAVGARQPVRYRWEPEAGRAELTAEEAATRAADYLTREFHERLRHGPAAFTLHAQLGEDGDPTHDPTVAWPEERKELTIGRLELTTPVEDQEHWDGQKFDPTRLTAGIELSDDPVLAFRAHAYAESFSRRSRHS